MDTKPTIAGYDAPAHWLQLLAHTASRLGENINEPPMEEGSLIARLTLRRTP